MSRVCVLLIGLKLAVVDLRRCRVPGVVAQAEAADGCGFVETASVRYVILHTHYCNTQLLTRHISQTPEGLQATSAESVVPKTHPNKKKGKKSAPRQRPTRITNVHLKGDIDLSKDYVPDR